MTNTHELLTSPLFIKSEHIFPYIPRLFNAVKGLPIDEKEKPELKASFYDQDSNEIQSEEAETKASNIAVINISGVLTKFGTWYDYGADDFAALLFDAYRDDTVKAIILKWHCAGGTDGAMISLKAALLRRNKPVISVVDNMMMSAAVYVAQYTDAIYAIDEMVKVGSIGVMIGFKNWDKWYAEANIEIHEIYPPESAWKNKAMREAKDGNYTVVIEETLTPWAQHFQKTVRENSPNIDESVEGLLGGREFFAYDAVENGLIKGIKPMDEIIQMAFDYTSTELLNLLK